MRGTIGTALHYVKQIINPDVPHKNSFNFIRLIAAVSVVYSHSYAIVGAHEPRIGSVNLGETGVWIFFLLSGYLVSASWHQHPRFNIFLAKRALRIFPGLLVMLVTTIIIGALFSTLKLHDYLSSQQTVSYLNNIFLYVPQFSLPGVFDTNRYPSVVNGSIWTLSYEFTMYIAIGIIGAAKLYRIVNIKKIWLTLLIICFVVYVTWQDIPSFSLFYLNIRSLLPFVLMFFTGVYVQERFDITKTKPIIGILMLGLFLMGCHFFPYLAPIFAATSLAYAIFSFGSLPHGAWLQKWGDFSYGIYIYAFPIQQAVEHVTKTGNELKLFLISMALVTPLAILSWFLVESPALKLKKKLKLERYPVTQPDEAW